jgi:hypothetical protein
MGIVCILSGISCVLIVALIGWSRVHGLIPGRGNPSLEEILARAKIKPDEMGRLEKELFAVKVHELSQIHVQHRRPAHISPSDEQAYLVRQGLGED